MKKNTPLFYWAQHEKEDIIIIIIKPTPKHYLFYSKWFNLSSYISTWFEPRHNLFTISF